MQRIFEFENRLPPWLRPTYRGALLVSGMGFGVSGKVVVLAMLGPWIILLGVGPTAALFVKTIVLVVMAGAVGGTIHGLLRPLENWGRTGVWGRWFLAAFGFAVTLAVITPGAPLSPGESTLYVLAAGFAVLVAGCLVFIDDRRAGRPTPDRFRRLQNRERLWAAEDRALIRLHSRLATGGRVPGGRIRRL